jgi:phenylpyruvate tautomerase PptA (4-oxalocrotonate tautomerase family)
MPMIDFILPRGALSAEKLETLMHKAVKTLMWWEKIPDTPEARKIAWAFVTEVDKRHVVVGGLPPDLPRYRFKVQTIEGLMDDRAKQGVIRDLTKLVLEAEGVPYDFENASRVWCILREYPRANWGIGGYPFAPSGYLSSAPEIRVSSEDHSR